MIYNKDSWAFSKFLVDIWAEILLNRCQAVFLKNAHNDIMRNRYDWLAGRKEGLERDIEKIGIKKVINWRRSRKLSKRQVFSVTSVFS